MSDIWTIQKRLDIIEKHLGIVWYEHCTVCLEKYSSYDEKGLGYCKTCRPDPRQFKEEVKDIGR